MYIDISICMHWCVYVCLCVSVSVYAHLPPPPTHLPPPLTHLPPPPSEGPSPKAFPLAPQWCQSGGYNIMWRRSASLGDYAIYSRPSSFVLTPYRVLSTFIGLVSHTLLWWNVVLPCSTTMIYYHEHDYIRCNQIFIYFYVSLLWTYLLGLLST